MRIVGLDVGRGYAVAAVLSCFPLNIQKYFKQNRQHIIKLKTNETGINQLLSLKPDGIIIEPSGFWYSNFWATVAERNKIQIFWISHAELAHQRGHYGFVNKRDDEDAISLAATYFDSNFITEQGEKRYLKHYGNSKVHTLRELFWQKEQMQKIRTGAIAILKQRLSYEFPEVVNHRMTISSIRGFTPIIGWLAGIHQDRRYDNLYDKSVVRQLNIKFSTYTIEHAQSIVIVEKRLSDNFWQTQRAIANEEFAAYQRVFDRFGFGLCLKTLLLIKIYPFEKFLVNGQPWIEWENSARNGGRRQKRHRSLRQFQAFLGLSFAYIESGGVKKRKFHGSSTIRSHLYMWAICMLTPSSQGYKIKSEVGKTLTDSYLKYRSQAAPIKGKDSVIRVLFKMTRLLFRELQREIRV